MGVRKLLYQGQELDNEIKGHTGNDIDAGMKAYNKIAEKGGGFWNYTSNSPTLFPSSSNNTYVFSDAPSRSKSQTNIYWKGDLFLQKKIDGIWINVMHITYGFKVNKKGKFSVTPLVINNGNN